MNRAALIVLAAWAVLAWPARAREAGAAVGHRPEEQGARLVLAQQQQPANQRPTTDQLGDPARPQTGQTSSEPISVDFADVPLIQVIQALGIHTGKNFELDPSIGNQRVTIIAHDKFPADQAYELLEAILANRNLVMAPALDGRLIQIRPRGQDRERMDIRIGRQPPERGFDNFIIYVIKVVYASASDVATILQSVGSANANITVYEQANTLIISDTTDGIRNMLTLLEQIDVPGNEVVMEFFMLQYTRAEILATQVEQILLDTGAPAGAPRAAQPVRTPIRTARPATAVPGQTEPEVISGQQPVLRLIADERLNALIVIATRSLMQQARLLIEQLDTPTPFERNNMHYRELLNAEAEKVEEVLTAITGTAPRQAAGPGQAGGAAASAEVQPFEKNIIIKRYDPTNALVIVATPQDYKLLGEMIDRLDVPRRQVNVEAVIMEVTITDTFELRVETAGLTANSLFALNNVVALANAIAGGPLSLAGLGTTIGIVDGTTEIPVPTGVDNQGNPTGIELQTIPNVPLLMQALERLTDVEVLSRPNLLTVDTETANIVVGQEIPVISSLADTDDRTGFINRSRVQREQVGVKLEVTPQINEGDYVAMDVRVEVSQPVVSTIGVDPNQVGATFQITESQNQVVIQDGKTGIIGGLLREARDRNTAQTPILGDVPLLGWLFRNKATTRNKQNLVILLTPNIIKEGHDLDRLTDFRLGRFYDRNVDVLFDKGGFIQKIKRKQYMRTDYHPTESYREEPGATRNFGRSRIER